jgi:subfamily B ATP-binding cassette protein MsbA
VTLTAFLRTVLGLTRPYRTRLVLGILCGFIAGLGNPLLMGSVKLVFEVVYPQPGAPSLAERLQGLTLLSPEDIPSIPKLLAQVKDLTNPVSTFLWNEFSPGAKQLLSEPDTTPDQVQLVLLDNLNKIIRTRELYAPDRFAKVPLRSETRALAAEHPTGAGRTRLNLLLLEDAYRGPIREQHRWSLRRRFPGLIEAGQPWLQRLTREHSPWLVVLAVSTIPFSMLVRGLFGYLNVYLMNWVSVRAVADLRARLFGHLMTLSASFFNKVSTGELMSRINEVHYLHSTISQAMVIVIREPVTLAGLAAFLLWQQPKLTLVALIVFPITLIPFVIYARKVRKSSVAIYQKYADMGRMLHESFTGFRIVKAYNLENIVITEFADTSRAAVSHFMRVLRSMEIPGPLMEFFAAVGVALFFIYVAVFVRATPGDLVAFVGAIFLMYQPIKALIRLHNQLEQAQAATQHAFEILNTRSTIVEPVHPQPLAASGADLRFQQVSFSYGDKPALRQIDLTVKAGQVVALVGSSGSGKTTLTNLLLRFYDPQEGAIFIGKTDIRNVALADLRRQIAIVTQETILFNDTIANNIALGRPGASHKEIVAAAKHAFAHDFIMEKKEGYETRIGEKGIALSGGQRQRLAIARAILKDAPILILDEAMSALDTESERVIQSALDDLMKHRTTICIAHRLSTIQNADCIVALQDGRIVQTGRHADLLRDGGLYRRLYELQFQSAPPTS